MKTKIIFCYQGSEKSPKSEQASKKYLVVKRLSPFLLLTGFLSLLFPYTLISGSETYTKLILFPFLIANTIFADFVIWNYLEGKKKGIIWIAESVVSVLVICWIS